MKKILIVLIVMVSACHKKASSEIGPKWENCRDKLSEATTIKKLVGGWKMVATGCAECLDPGVHPTDKKVKLIILADQTFKTYEDNVLITDLEFNLGGTAGREFFQFEVKRPNYSSYAHGIIEFCGDRLAFKNSYMDGTDYYFVRVK